MKYISKFHIFILKRFNFKTYGYNFIISGKEEINPLDINNLIRIFNASKFGTPGTYAREAA